MAGSAASFLTFSRRLLLRPSISIRLSTATTSVARQRACLSTSARLAKREDGTPHATDKARDGARDVQSESSRSGMEGRNRSDNNEAASSEADTRNNSQRAKEEMPEAPKGPVIGMQDERGGKGH